MSVLADVSREAARRFPSRVALVHEARALTYAQLDALADETAAGLARRGLRGGDVVALALPASAEYVVAYVALARLGAVVSGISPRSPAPERATLLAQLAPDVAVATDDLTDGIPGGVDVVRVSVSDDVAGILRDVRLDGAEPPGSPNDPDASETVVFTSGTTGIPKGAVFDGRRIAAITAMDTGGAWGAGRPQLVATGLSHVGFMTKLAGHLQAGSTMHVLTRWRAADALRVIARERMPYIGGVAAQVSLLLSVPDFDRYDLRAVQGLIIGAGPSPAALVREARARFHAPYSIRYSSTESGGLGTMTAFDAPDHEVLETVGRPRPGTELEIRDRETGAVLGTGEVGQICLRSPAVMTGYWRNPDATAAALDADGWLRTGDLGCIREDGCLRITGRVADMYIRGGYNVYPQEVEAVLLEHPAVANVVVVARPSDVMGEIGVAVVVPRADAPEPSLDDLRAFAAPRLAAYKLPEALRVVDALPLTGMDKVDRRALAARERERE
ncbi:MAG TPA: class I adenylate-forming enzyme family protein [Acidimicrobiia bacterium]|nr:class I adenylate-forming enzyme family protein [Acidimicrobiia bacterium]